MEERTGDQDIGVPSPETEEAQEGDEVRLTGMTVKVVPEEEAKDTLKKKLPTTSPD